MKYEVVLIESDEGFAVHCPALPACWSQGATPEEAIENIRAAISEYLDYVSDRATLRKEQILDEGQRSGFQVELREIQVPV